MDGVLEDYYFTLHYHPGKANVVADALSRKSQGALASIASREWRMLETLGQFGLQYSEQVLDHKDIYKFITLLPKDYCLIPGNGAIKFVRIKKTCTN